jgi:hypothetical protein
MLLKVSALLFAAALVQQPSKAGIQGIVLRAGTGQPVAGAKVTATRQGRIGNQPPGPNQPPNPRQPAPAGPLALTDDNGKFVLQDLDEGSYTLQVQGNGYLQYVYGQRSAGAPGTPLSVTAGHTLNDITVTLTPAGNISGRIRDSSGQPVVNVSVELLHLAYNATGQRAYWSAGAVQTNDRGEYRIYWVNPGRYYVRAGTPTSGSDALIQMISGMLSRGANGNTVPASFGYAFYPGATDISTARSVDIQAGAEVQAIDFVLPSKPRTYKLRGRVIDSRTGQPPATVQITASPHGPGTEQPVPSGMVGGGLPNEHYDKTTGAFEVANLLPGTYSVIATIADAIGGIGAQGGPPASGRTTAAITDTDAEGIDVAIYPAVAIPGRFIVEGQLPQGATLERLRMTMITQSEREIVMRFAGMKTNADGTFVLNDVSPGEYRFQLQPDFGSLYIKEARFGGRDVLNYPFQFSGSADGTLDIVLGRMAGRVTGVVRDPRSQAAPVSRVVLIPDRARERTELFKVTWTDDNGSFSFSGIAPGDYKVFAWDTVEEFAWYDSELLAQSETKGRAVHVTETSTETIDVTLIPGGGTR